MPIMIHKAVSAFLDTSSVGHTKIFGRRAVILHPTVSLGHSLTATANYLYCFN